MYNYTMNKAKYNILIVDDVKENRILVQEILKYEGYTTAVVSDGLSALRIVKEKEFDLVLLDIMMPIMDGIETCRYLKVEPETASIPVIFLTASTDTKTLTRAYHVGGTDYILKPFFKEELLARVESRLKLRDYEKNLEKKVEQRTKEISETQVQLMHILGGIAEGHSAETYKHVKRVSEFTYRLARLYGLDKEESIVLKNASSLHDIGKLGISDNILNKKSSLDKSEYKEMQKHSMIGADMLRYSKLPLFEVATIVAEQHHEKYNGTGYPHRLVANDIHIYARIVALADVFDALLFSRAYKKGWELSEVLAYIKDMRGEHFDPNLIDLFFENKHVFLQIYDIQITDDKLDKKLNKKKRGKIMEWLLQEI